jgi:hypothetical protein
MRFFPTIFWLVALLFAQVVLAQQDVTQTQTEPAREPVNHERVYQVELIVFGRPDTNSQEIWPNNFQLAYPENLVVVKDEANAEGMKLLPAAERTLNPQSSVLAKSGSYTLLYHQAWRQTIYGRKANLLITGGKTFNGHQELEGFISLSVGQYLKLQTNLWLTQFAPAGSQVTESWPELPVIPGAEAAPNTQDYLVKRVVKLSQQRSMRSNEIHYIDHPLMGVIIKIFPYDAGQ